jgi:hypothetical protein
MAVLRWILTVPFAVFLLLGALDIRNPDAAVLGVFLVVGFGMSNRRIRGSVGRALRRSNALFAVDVILWNGFLAFVLLEFGLAVADHVLPSPLLMAPNAKSQERIDHYKNSLPARMDSDPRNSQGFNDTEWAIPKPPRTFRIVALGDSFAFGVVGYEKNFLTILEEKLTGSGPGRVEVCNLGIPALDPIDYLQLLDLEGRELEPDLVLVCLFAGNDFVRTARGSRLRLRNTRTFAVLWRLWRLHEESLRRRVSGQSPAKEPGPFVEPPTFSDEAYLDIAARYLEILRRQYSAETRRKVRDTLEVLDRIASQTGDGRLVIAILPCEVQVNAALRLKVCRSVAVSESDLDLDHPVHLVRDHFRGRDVTVVDLLPHFEAAEEDGSTYRHNDSHWNARGNRVAAGVLAPVLRSRIDAMAP